MVDFREEFLQPTWASKVGRYQADFDNELEKLANTVASPTSSPKGGLTGALRCIRVIHTRLKHIESYIEEIEAAKAAKSARKTAKAERKWASTAKKRKAVSTNRFANASSIPQVIGEAIGAGSVAWVGGTGSLEFDSTKASKVLDEAVERIGQILKEGKVNG